jgi:hypothetical protein
MTDLEIMLHGKLGTEHVIAGIEDVLAGEGLNLTMRTGLKKFPGCTHWHFKKDQQPGVLEVTWWPRDGQSKPPRLWLSVHGNRSADWIDQLMPGLKTKIETRLARSV